MRLTIKRGNNYDFDENDQIEEVSIKLGQLEDIEDELGIDLITLFEILKQDCIYRKRHFPDCIIKCHPVGIQANGLRVLDEDESYIEDTVVLEYENFGKTWALTKEELL